jgi:hypothetical protein
MGEFHTVTCALIAIGSLIEGSSIHFVLVMQGLSADVNGPLETLIFAGKHM